MAPALCLQLRADVREFDRRLVELKSVVDLHLPEVLLNAAMQMRMSSGLEANGPGCDGNIRNIIRVSPGDGSAAVFALRQDGGLQTLS